MINSRAKGSTAEREFAGLVQDWSGVRLIRNLDQTRSGGHDLLVHPNEDGPVAEAFRKLAIECKRYRAVTEGGLSKFWQQAITQAEQAKLIPILAYRADRSPWRVIVPMRVLNPHFSHSHQLGYAATLNIEGFCHVISEMSITSGVKRYAG